jgi:hypothetical protein
MPQTLRLIVAALSEEPAIIQKTIRIVAYHMKNYAKSYRSFSKKRKRLQAA